MLPLSQANIIKKGLFCKVYIVQARQSKSNNSIEDYIANIHGIVNCFRIFNEQNELLDPKKVFKNSATSATRTLAWSRGSLMQIAQRCSATYRSC
jgi:hypothetical protein